MPMYEYQCPVCSTVIEEVVNLSDKDNRVFFCEVCPDTKRMVKIISSGSTQFNSGGFDETDYKSRS